MTHPNWHQIKHTCKHRRRAGGRELDTRKSVFSSFLQEEGKRQQANKVGVSMFRDTKLQKENKDSQIFRSAERGAEGKQGVASCFLFMGHQKRDT